MRKRVSFTLAASALLLWVAASMCVAQPDQIGLMTRRALEAYRVKDYATFLTIERRILAIRPLDARTIYNVACGEALFARPAESVHLLDRLVSQGLDFDADKDPDFASIVNSTEWASFKARLAKLRTPVVHSTTAFTLPTAGLVATSLAVDQPSGDIYIASARARKIVKRSPDGALSDFATDKDGLLAVSAVVIDPVRKQLLASFAAVAFMQGFSPEDQGKTGVCAFDLATGKLLRKVFLTATTGNHLLNEMVVDQSGNIFVVDSGSGEIYRLRRASSEFELYLSSVVFSAPQGLAFSADGRTLYVADFISGLWAVEVLSTDRRHIDVPPELYLPGLLGLARFKNDFIAVQNGVRPNRVVLIHLDAKAERVTSLETLESNHPDYAGPTQGVLSGSDFLYIANSQINLIDPKTGTFPQAKAQPTIVLRLPVGN